MNANELADELKDMCIALSVAEHWVPVLSEAATMLRQQQAEIELLNAKLAYMFEQELKTARLNK